MDLKIEHLRFLIDSRQTLKNGKNSNVARLNNLKRKNIINEEAESFFIEQGIAPFNEPISKFQNKILGILNFIPIYIDYLKDFRTISPFDCAELIVLIEDIERFESVNNFYAYCGVAPVVSCSDKVSKMKSGVNYSDCNVIGNERSRLKNVSYNERVKKVVFRIVKQLLRTNEEYMDLYEKVWQEEFEKDFSITKKHVAARVRRKFSKKFLKDLYKNWKNINKEICFSDIEYEWR